MTTHAMCAMRQTLFGGLFILAVGAEAMADADAPPTGTTLGYDSFTCTISNSGEDSVCTIEGGGRVTLFAQMFNNGRVPEAGHFGVLRGNSSLGIRSIELNETSRAALRQLFPLSIGNSVAYRYEAEIAAVRTGWQGQSVTMSTTINATVTVAGEETVSIDGQSYRALVVTEVTRPFGISDVPRSVLQRTWWFVPDLGVTAKARYAWTTGWNQGAVGESTLHRVLWPGGVAPLTN